MKKIFALLLVVAMSLSLAACGADKVVRTESWVTDDGMEITQGYNKDGNHISEISTMADGSYHEFQYDKNGNITKEIHK
ncbi:MAG: hypothetical protein IKM51_00405 [Oscillospiraceae bacterium]|nr:hypothetical protein [Oscillospiraceae bacterium]